MLYEMKSANKKQLWLLYMQEWKSIAQSTRINIIDWLIDLNSMSTCSGLFYA